MTAQPPASQGQPRRPALVVATVFALLVHLAALYLPSVPGAAGDPPGLDKLAHLAIFAVPVWLVGVLVGRIWVVAAVFAGHAVISELVQHWLLPQRSGDPLDLLADLAGIALAVVLLTRRASEGSRRPDAPH